jgi:hypothetical protein
LRRLRKRGRRTLRTLAKRSTVIRWWRREGRKGLRSATTVRRDRVRLQIAGALDPIVEFSNKRPAGAIPPDFNDLWFLYHAVRTRRPRPLLEFGSGYSTVVLAFALQQNGEGHLWSLDAEEEWARSTAASLPDALRPLVTVVHAPVREDDRDVLGWSHENVPEINPDFVYLDGPALTRERQVAFDVLDLQGRLQHRCLVVVDGRRKNAEYLRDRLTRQYAYRARGPWRHVFEIEP